MPVSPSAPVMRVAPSILSADFGRLSEAIDQVSSGTDWLHVDVMDGHFVPNLSIGPPVVASLRKHSDLFFDTHLMITDPGRFQDGTQDFSAQIAAFKTAGVDIVTGVVIPPDAKTFLTQARQQGLKPKVITLGKALLFPGAIEALGDLGDGLTTEVWWSPSHPFTSSLTKQSARALADAYEAGAHKQWTQPIGFAHALFEVAADTLRRSKSLGAKDVRDSLVATNLNTVVGPVKWGGQGPFKNVSKTPLVLGQWGKGKKYKMELVIVNDEAAKNIPAGGTMRLM